MGTGRREVRQNAEYAKDRAPYTFLSSVVAFQTAAKMFCCGAVLMINDWVCTYSPVGDSWFAGYIPCKKCGGKSERRRQAEIAAEG